MEIKKGYVVGALMWMSVVTGVGTYATLEMIDTDRSVNEYSIQQQVNRIEHQSLSNILKIQSMEKEMADYGKESFGMCGCIRTENNIHERRFCEFRCDTEKLVKRCEARHKGYQCG